MINGGGRPRINQKNTTGFSRLTCGEQEAEAREFGGHLRAAGGGQNQWSPAQGTWKNQGRITNISSKWKKLLTQASTPRKNPFADTSPGRNENRLWMDNILHHLVGGLPMFIQQFTGVSHVSSIPTGAGFCPSTVCSVISPLKPG